jgi:hypothetical protein
MIKLLTRHLHQFYEQNRCPRAPESPRRVLEMAELLFDPPSFGSRR